MNLIMLSLNSKRNVKVDSEAYDICRAIIRQRNKKRTEGIDVFLSLLRLLMLAKSLKFIKLIKVLKLKLYVFSGSILFLSLFVELFLRLSVYLKSFAN